MESSTWRSDQQHHQHALNTPSDEDKARIISSFQSEGLLCRMCVSLALWRFEQLTIHDDPCPCLFHMWRSATFEYIIAKSKPQHFFVTWPGSLCHASFPYGHFIDAIPFPPVCWLLFTLVCTRTHKQNPRVPTMGAGETPCTHSAITHSVSLSQTKRHHVSDMIWVECGGWHTPSIYQLNNIFLTTGAICTAWRTLQHEYVKLRQLIEEIHPYRNIHMNAVNSKCTS